MKSKMEVFLDHVQNSNIAEAMSLGEEIGWTKIDLNLATRIACVSQSRKMIDAICEKFEIGNQTQDQRTKLLVEKFHQEHKKSLDSGIIFR